jgi:hypothetical protein
MSNVRRQLCDIDIDFCAYVLLFGIRCSEIQRLTMILSKNIPFRAATFVRRCTDDVLRGRYAPAPDAYLSFLIEQTEKRNRKLIEYIRVVDRSTGQPRFSADADHIIPKSVWGILMFGFIEPGKCGTSFNVLSNLFWRDRQWNQRDDGSAIRVILSEAKSIRLASRAGIAWREKWIEIFLRTKRDEGLLFAGDLVDPFMLDELQAPEEHSNWMSRR